MTESLDEGPTELDRLDPAAAEAQATLPPMSPSPEPVRPGAAESAVLRDLARLPDDLRESAVAVTVLILARSLDEGGMMPRDAVTCVREVRMGIAQLREWNPAGESGDETDATREQMDNVRALYVAE